MKSIVYLLLVSATSAFISEDLHEIASKQPEIAILQNKLQKMQRLKPRIHRAVGNINEMLKHPQREEEQAFSADPVVKQKIQSKAKVPK